MSIERVWQPPCGCPADPCDSAQPQLVLYNSLVDRKVPFVPAAGPQSKQITWYTCGERRRRRCRRSLLRPPRAALLPCCFAQLCYYMLRAVSNAWLEWLG